MCHTVCTRRTAVSPLKTSTPHTFVGGGYHREFPGVAPFRSKRLDVAVVQHHFPAALAPSQDLGEADSGLFGRVPLILPRLGV
jgi:hypothetical protein